MFYPTGDKALYYIDRGSMRSTDSAKEVDEAQVFCFETEDSVTFLASSYCLDDNDLSRLPSLSLITEPESLYPFLSIEMNLEKNHRLSAKYSSLLDHRRLLAGELLNSCGSPVVLVAVSIMQDHLSLHYSNADVLRLHIPPTRASFYSLDVRFLIPEYKNAYSDDWYVPVTPEVTIRIEATNSGSVYSYKIIEQGDSITQEKHIMTVKWRPQSESMQVDMRYALTEMDENRFSQTFPGRLDKKSETLFIDTKNRLFYHR